MTAQDLINAGYGGYQGWSDTEAANDFAATGGNGKFSGGGSTPGVTVGANGIPMFNYDYAAAAKKAYGDLGPYYDKLLTESKGDMNLALSRLVEDYTNGVRVKTNATNTSKGEIDAAATEAMRRNAIQHQQIIGNANARGLFTKSLYTPPGQSGEQNGTGIPDVNAANLDAGATYAQQRRQVQKQNLDTNLANYVEQFGPKGVKLSRATTDTATKIQRKGEQLDQARKQEAAGMANTQGAQAYQGYLNNLSTYG